MSKGNYTLICKSSHVFNQDTRLILVDLLLSQDTGQTAYYSDLIVLPLLVSFIVIVIIIVIIILLRDKLHINHQPAPPRFR